MRAAPAVMLLSAVLALSNVAAAQPTVQPRPATVSARHTVTVALDLSNTGAEPVTLPLHTLAPDGWDVLIAPTPVTLAPGEQQVALLTLRPPAMLGSGTHPLTLTVDGAALTTAVTVAPRAQITLTAQAPATTQPAYAVPFRIHNAGNTTETLTLTARGPGRPALSAARVTLQPGETQTVTVSGVVPGGMTTHSLTLRAENPQTPGTLQERTVVMDVLTPAPSDQDATQRLPVQLTTDAGTSGTTFSVQASGEITPGVDLTFRAGPGQVDATVRQNGRELSAGLTSVGYSPLASPVPATAVRVTTPIPDGTLGGYVGLDRTGQGAPVFGVQYTRSSRDLNLTAAADLSSGAASATVTVRAAQGAASAQGTLTAEQDGDYAVDASLSRQGPVSVQLSGTYRDPGFDRSALGALHGGVFTTVTRPGFSVGAHVRTQLTLNPDRSVRTANTELAAQFRTDTHDLSVRAQLQDDRTFGQQTATFGVRLATPTHWGALTQHVTYTTRLGGDAGTLTSQTQLNTTTGAWTLSPQAQVTLDLRSAQTTIGAGLGGTWQQGPWTVSGVVNVPDLTTPGATLNVRVDHLLSSGVTLTASGSTGLGDVRVPTQLRAGLSVPVNVPLYRRADVGRLEGTLRGETGAPLPGRVVRAGPYYVTTGPDGHFTFPALTHGTYLLNLTGPLGEWCTPPANVTVTAGRTTTADLSCRAAVDTVMQLQARTPGQAAAALAMPGVTVTLTSDLGRWEVRSDAHGRVDFGPLPSGTYRVTVSASATQLRAFLPPTPFTVTLGGAAMQVNVPLDRRPRNIDIQPVTPALRETPGAPSTALPGDPQSAAPAKETP